MKAKGFTIVELLIVMVILGILIALVFQTYSKISDVSFRIEQEKVLEEEVIYFSQILQNLSERNTIDWKKYNWDLVGNKGFTETLYMSGLDWKFSIYSTGNCSDEIISILDEDYNEEWCWLEMKKETTNWWITSVALTEVWNTFFSKVKFKIVPFASEDEILDDPALCTTNYFACLHSEWFWVFTTAYIPNYSEAMRANDVKQKVQMFFNLWL